MEKLLALILICLLIGCCWYWFSHARDVDPNALPTSMYLSEDPNDIAIVKKKTDEMPAWPVIICIIFMGSTSIVFVIPGNVFSLITAIICCLILIVTGHYMYICLALLLQIIIIPTAIIALGKSLL
ncbi:MAG: hypothetical protein ACYC54_15005 [Sedimentisphaerales bacterium]